ncbi:DUF3244 domain-containing protein [Negadavirga shengliensis]|uniref:DUF3244 domain-containing protein n=1 Tax=Negadavirga shengliensis TaxID=1389218 RepID=A0ABV9SX72_9BACT
MKTLFTVLFASVLFSFASASPINKELQESTSVKSENQKIHVTFTAPMEKVAVRIKDKNGKTLARKTYKTKEPVTIPYDLSLLPESVYTVEVSNGEEKATYTVENKKAPALPLMAYGKKKSDNVVSLLVVGLTKPGTEVAFYDESGTKIKTDYVRQSEGFRRDYRFQNLRNELSHMVVTDAQGRVKTIQLAD